MTAILESIDVLLLNLNLHLVNLNLLVILCRDFAPYDADNLSPFIVRDVAKVG